MLRRYFIQKREDYVKYNRIVGKTQKLINELAQLDARDPYRIETTQQLLEKLFQMGLIPNKKSLATAKKKVTASAFCRRRLSVVMVRLKMAESVKKAVELIEQQHVRVGPHVVTDPAFLVTRSLEDFVTWTDDSKIRRHIMRYHEQLDDFDLLGE